MTAIHAQSRRTRKTKTPTRFRRRRRLPRLGWGWAVIAITVIAAVRTWPLQAAALTVLLAAAVIIRAIQPRWFRRLHERTSHLHPRRPALPAPGRRTLDTFLRMRHDQFEHGIAALAREHPTVRDATKCGKSADRGVDVLVHLNNGTRILIQCKHYAPGRNNVGGPAVREIAGSVLANQCHYGAIVTTSDFTAEAYDTNYQLGRNGLTLMNGHTLTAWANGGTPPWA